MKLIVDANIVAAAIIRSGLSRNLLFSSGLELYSPDYLISEISAHETEFIKQANVGKNEFLQLSALVLECISLMPTDDFISKKSRAVELVLDHDDWPYIAAAISARCPLWSNDRGLKKQKEVKIYSTADLLAYFRGNGVYWL
ncbi:MAG: PIN domain-containing protein [Candidatus Micrarchaeota archaeon]